MKKSLRVLLLLSFPCLCTVNAVAQDEIEKFLQGNIKDAEKLLGAYVAPAMKSVSLGLNQGWYNTGKAHKAFGVDFTTTVNLMLVPEAELWFTPNDVVGPDGHLILDESSPDFPKAPTMFGPDDDSRKPVYNLEDDDGNVIWTYNDVPAGVLDIKKEIGYTVVPVVNYNLGFGIGKGTDIKLRYLPEMNLGDDAKLKMFGLGVMHDVKQWIPGLKNLPFDLSGFVGYTKMSVAVDIENPDYDNQKGEFTISGTTVQGIISKKISVLTLYGGLGYNIAKSTLAMKGTYYIEDPVTSIGQEYNDPVKINQSASGPRMTAGFRLKLAVFTLHADYTLAKYSCLTAGFGISVR
jgi:hypothetical protein